MFSPFKIKNVSAIFLSNNLMCPRFKRVGKNDQIRGSYTTFLQKNIVVCNPKNRWTNASCLMSLVSCLMLHMFLSCLIRPYHSLSYLIMPYHALSIYDSCLMPLASCLLPHDSWLMFLVSCLMRYETWAHGGGGVHEAWNMSHEPSRFETWELSHETWLVPRGSWIMTHDSCFISHGSRSPTFHGSCLTSYDPRLTSHVSRLMFPVP